MNAVFSAVKVCASNEAIRPRCFSRSWVAPHTPGERHDAHAIRQRGCARERRIMASVDEDECMQSRQSRMVRLCAVTRPPRFASGANPPSTIGGHRREMQSSLRVVGNPSVSKAGDGGQTHARTDCGARAAVRRKGFEARRLRLDHATAPRRASRSPCLEARARAPCLPSAMRATSSAEIRHDVFSRRW